MKRALCATHPEPDLWFSQSVADREVAALLCRRCPVKLECLADAVSRPEVHGVWGGTTEVQRRVLVQDAGRRFVEPESRRPVRRHRDGELVVAS